MVKKKIYKVVAILVIINHLITLVVPPKAFGLTSGPSSPEFSSFEPVVTTDMVNLFSGEFTYNLPVLDIPGPEGSGYALSLSYHSGSTTEQEASWVGFGWTLNPGSINRNTRGFPDEYNGTAIKRYNKSIPNLSGSVTRRIGNPEIFGADIPLSASTTIRANNYQGISKALGFGLNIKGMVSLNMNLDADGPTFSVDVNPSALLNNRSSDDEDNESKAKNNDSKDENDNEKRIQFKSWDPESLGKSALGQLGKLASSYGLYTHSEVVRATSFAEYSGKSYNLTLLSVQINPGIIPVGLEGSFEGNVNYQENAEETSYQAYGFLNNQGIETLEGTSALTDYYVENGSSYNKRDYKLGIPFNNVDNFVVTGENLSGGFRYYPTKTGHHYPNFGYSQIDAYTAGIELMIGPNIGIGLDFGFGDQISSSANWSYSNSSGSKDPSRFQYTSPSGFFRFNNDLGGKVEYSANTGIDVSGIHMESSIPAVKRARPVINNAVYEELNNSQVSGRASHIDYHTFGNLSPFNKNVNRQEINSHSGVSNAIAEFSITNEDGNKSIYGLPVMNKNERSLQFQALPSSRVPCVGGTTANCNLDNYLIYQKAALNNQFEPQLDDHDIVIGESKSEPYASSFLLTQILSANYVDTDPNTAGPDATDFGGWTNFHYHRKYGGSQPWYRWRTPYTGMLYQKNQLSDTNDDMASLSFGEKEVYYLKAIETKTHIAFFITNKTTAARFTDFIPAAGPVRDALNVYLNGSNADRKDGLGASRTRNSNQELAANDMQAKDNNQTLEYLESIQLFSKERLDKPVKTIRFQHDYSLVSNLPNNRDGQYPLNNDQAGSGKLTLKKVWFEYEGLARTRISPYEFTYEYKKQRDFPDELKNHPDGMIQQIINYDDQYDEASENPDYQPQLLDDWGNNQPSARDRMAKMKPSFQEALTPRAFDPAAWQLKQIKLPSGGVILVQYEQADYSYVQDRNAMALVSLLGDPASNDTFTLNLRDIGINPANRNAVDSLKTMIENYFGLNGEKEKIYFKFLYHFENDLPSLDNCMSEFITGYAEFENVSIEAAGSEYRLKIKVKGRNMGDDGRTTLPHTACYDYYTSLRQRFEMRNYSGATPAVKECYIPHYTSKVQMVMDGDLTLGDTFDMLERLIEDWDEFSEDDLPSVNRVCLQLNPEHSYLKIPMTRSKKGGGIRVKRLLLFDQGIESGDAAIYGNIYRYKNSDGKSSGVATNEPSTMREENALVTFMPRKEQSWFSRLTAGLDKKQMEGPIGESILPAPSIGYSQVEVNNIHSGKTGSGYSVHQFYTVKDYAFDKYYSTDDIAAGKGASFSDLAANTESDFMPLPLGLINYNVNKAWMSQGFKFIVNNMHGVTKAILNYGIGPNDRAYLSSAEEFQYYEPGEKVKVVQADGSYILDTPGKEMDLCMEMKSIMSEGFDLSFEADVSIGLSWFPPIFITVVPTISLDESGISTHVTSKIVRYPAILKNKTTYLDGAFNVEEYLAFSPFTGKPLLTRTFDGYHDVKIGSEKRNGSIYKLDIPAAFIYSEMGPAYQNPTANTNQLNAITGTFMTYGKNGFPLRPHGTAGNWNIQDVISAKVETFSNAAQSPFWINDQVLNDYRPQGATGFSAAPFHHFWYPNVTYVYKAEITSAISSADDKVYEAGMFKNFNMFDWANESANLNQGWIKTNQITKYSPNGMVLEEQDALGIYHAAKFDRGYKFNVPTMRADNARYETLYFTDFENTPGASQFTSHSGKASKVLSKNMLTSGIVIADNLIAATQIKEGLGSRLMCWVKAISQADITLLNLQVSGVNSRLELKRIADVNGWTLLYADILPTDISSINTNAAFSLEFISTGTLAQDIYIDDVRFQPYESQASCYVYDPQTLRLLTQFDDQHFGLYYQYNQEGKLIRKSVETERGIRTIQETQYNSPMQQ